MEVGKTIGFAIVLLKVSVISSMVSIATIINGYLWCDTFLKIKVNRKLKLDIKVYKVCQNVSQNVNKKNTHLLEVGGMD